MLSSPRYIEHNYFFDLLFSFSGVLGIAFVFFLDKSHFLLSVLLVIGGFLALHNIVLWQNFFRGISQSCSLAVYV